MQLVETSLFGLRAARHRLTSPAHRVSVTLYPMVHVGEAAFFDHIYQEAFRHDVVLVEGVRSPVSKCLTRVYRWLNFDRLGLVIQPRTPLSHAVSARIVHADLSGEEFETEWRKVPMLHRLAVLALSPLIGLKLRLFGSRDSIAYRMTLEDRRSSEEVLSWDPVWAALDHSLLGARDARLVERLREQLDQPAAQERSVAIVFGAAHMRAVLGELAGRGFRSVESKWLTVFSL
jgi:hypothetical protein